jgi:hypothetical protein
MFIIAYINPINTYSQQLSVKGSMLKGGSEVRGSTSSSEVYYYNFRWLVVGMRLLYLSIHTVDIEKE